MRALLGLNPFPETGTLLTVLFFTFFVGLIWFVYRKDRKSTYAKIERLPFEEA